MKRLTEWNVWLGPITAYLMALGHFRCSHSEGCWAEPDEWVQ